MTGWANYFYRYYEKWLCLELGIQILCLSFASFASLKKKFVKCCCYLVSFSISVTASFYFPTELKLPTDLYIPLWSSHYIVLPCLHQNAFFHNELIRAISKSSIENRFDRQSQTDGKRTVTFSKEKVISFSGKKIFKRNSKSSTSLSPGEWMGFFTKPRKCHSLKKGCPNWILHPWKKEILRSFTSKIRECANDFLFFYFLIFHFGTLRLRNIIQDIKVFWIPQNKNLVFLKFFWPKFLTKIII